MPRLPTVYLPHSGGPWPLMAMARDPGHQGLTAYLQGLAQRAAGAEAVLWISAHWEEAQPTLLSSAAPPLLYDYSGFPPETYQIAWRAPGAPALAAAIAARLGAAGLPALQNNVRGFDHGVFVPAMVGWPAGAPPMLQLSLLRGLDPAAHLQLGRALAPLRDEGVLIVGSGMSYHNLRALFSGRSDEVARHSAAFDAWLQQSCALPPAARAAQLLAWRRAPAALECHPREEHLLPLHVVAGAAEDAAGQVRFSTRLMGAQVSAIEFGGA